jgi:hypothetical protein
MIVCGVREGGIKIGFGYYLKRDSSAPWEMTRWRERTKR